MTSALRVLGRQERQLNLVLTCPWTMTVMVMVVMVVRLALKIGDLSLLPCPPFCPSPTQPASHPHQRDLTLESSGPIFWLHVVPRRIRDSRG